MQAAGDMALVREYALRNSEEAFAELVTRHLNLVYSTALRKTSDADAAAEITQVVFIILARKAAKLRTGTILSGWLYQTTRLTAASHRRTAIRRALREQEAYMQSLSPEVEADAWREIAPLLEDAMGQLGEKHRNAILLRFFEKKSFHEIGVAFGASENAAKKRVAYALEKLRKLLAKRRVASTASVIAGVVSTKAIQAAPPAMAAEAMAAVFPGAAVTAAQLGLVSAVLRMMMWAKLKSGLGVAGAVLLAGGVAVTVAVFNRELSAPEVLQRAQAKYASLSSYRETVKTRVRTELPPDAPIQGGDSSGSSSIKLGRPNLYRIEYDADSPTNQFALWTAGDGDFWLLQSERYYRSREEPKPVKSGSPFFSEPAALVPAAFFKKTERNSLAALAVSADLIRLEDERIGGVNCHTLSGSVDGPGRRKIKMTVWIGQADRLVRQVQTVTAREVQLPARGKKAGGGEVRKPYTLTHTIMQTHENIEVDPPFTRPDFARAVPAGVAPGDAFP